MRRAIVAACLCWFAICTADRPNIAPLAFGMTPESASAALGVPLTYVAGRAGSEVYVAEGTTGVPSIYPIKEKLVLQFRRGALTGWKYDWRLYKPTPF